MRCFTVNNWMSVQNGIHVQKNKGSIDTNIIFLGRDDISPVCMRENDVCVKRILVDEPLVVPQISIAHTYPPEIKNSFVYNADTSVFRTICGDVITSVHKILRREEDSKDERALVRVLFHKEAFTFSEVNVWMRQIPFRIENGSVVRFMNSYGFFQRGVCGSYIFFRDMFLIFFRKASVVFEVPGFMYAPRISWKNGEIEMTSD